MDIPSRVMKSPASRLLFVPLLVGLVGILVIISVNPILDFFGFWERAFISGAMQNRLLVMLAYFVFVWVIFLLLARFLKKLSADKIAVMLLVVVLSVAVLFTAIWIWTITGPANCTGFFGVSQPCTANLVFVMAVLMASPIGILFGLSVVVGITVVLYRVCARIIKHKKVK